MGAEGVLSSFPGMQFPFFHFSRAISTLINWKLSSFGPLDICVLPLKGSVILAEKRWRLFICRALWPSPTFKLQHCYLKGKGNPESQGRTQIASMWSKACGNDPHREQGAWEQPSRKSDCWMEICLEVGKGSAWAPVPLWTSETYLWATH